MKLLSSIFEGAVASFSPFPGLTETHGHFSLICVYVYVHVHAFEHVCVHGRI